MRHMFCLRLCLLGLTLGVFVLISFTGCASGAGDGSGNTNGNDNQGDPQTGQPVDADNDGVRDDIDECPQTPSGASVDETGCPDGQGEPIPPDDDGDGVTNDADTCADTPAQAPVDASGCSASQRDTDGDGVMDDVDQCEDTPSTVTADEVGCPVSVPGTPDSDGDGVADDIDQCDNTPSGADVDPNGCADGQLDGDEDGVTDDIDQCDDTPSGEEVDPNGCAAGQRDGDNDGVFDDVDQCPDTPERAPVDADGCAVRLPPPPPPPGGNNGGGAVCGNNEVESGEQCDPPDGVTCDSACQSIDTGVPTNDTCDSPSTLTDNASTPFSNVGATTDVINVGGACSVAVETVSDIWYCYEAPCTGTATISLCGSSYDTTVEIYRGCDCPLSGAIGCNDDGCASNSSRATFPAIAGQSYMVRVGGYAGAIAIGDDQGDGTMVAFCGDAAGRGPSACGPAADSCFAVHQSPACDDAACCSRLCSVDPYCCDFDWDDRCKQEADGICGPGFDSCASGAGDCGSPNGTAGCDDPVCCQATCELDPFCCLDDWDQACMEEAADTCEGVTIDFPQICANATNNCTETNTNAVGCNNEACCLSVCQGDSFCCIDGWDAECALAGRACQVP